MQIKLSELKAIVHEVEANVPVDADPFVIVRTQVEPVPHARYGEYRFFVDYPDMPRIGLIEDGKLVRGLI